MKKGKNIKRKRSFLGVILPYLIVVCLLVVLAGMLLPSLSMARESARSISRKNRLKMLELEYQMGRCNSNFNTEEYDRIYENQFMPVKQNPLSTFSIDVDTASYSNMRRFISEGQLPPEDAVRIEECINYFNYDYPDPTDDAPFSVVTEISDCPWNPEHQLAHIGLQGKRQDTDKKLPSNLVFLIDVSGSMQSSYKLPLLKNAFQILVKKLGENDTVSIVVYAGSEGIALPATPGNEKSTILRAINYLSAGGSTAGAEGIRLAYKIAKQNFIPDGNNRVILATDGDFNVGITSDSELVRLIETKRDQQIYLTVLGFGTGNYKDSKMEKLADKGNGNYAYIDNLFEAQKVLGTELTGTLFTIAKDVKIQVEFNPEKVKAYRLLGYENRMLKDVDFNDDIKDAGELGSGHSVTALYELIPAESDEKVPTVDKLKYQKTVISYNTESVNELMNIKIRYKKPKSTESILMIKPVSDRKILLAETSDNFRFSAAVAAFGLLLRNSQYKGSLTYEQVLKLAEKAKGEDRYGYRSEFIKLVDLTRVLPENNKNM